MKILPLYGSIILILAAAAAEPASLADAVAGGKFSANVRLRYENVEQTGLREANALTLRTRLGFTTAPLQGWKAMLEAENIIAADGDSYSQAGLNAGGAGRAVVADPETTEINQAILSFTGGKTTVAAGRQRLVLDNARFIGDVGWRQNAQTFDAVSVQNKSLDQTTLTYAYLEQINRVFSDRHAQGKWQSNSHLLNASYGGYPVGTLTGYVYLLDFENVAAAAQSCATYGVSFSGTAKLTEALKLAYRAEFAHQTDYGSSVLNYSTTYYALEAGLAGKAGSFMLGHEVLGSDNNVGFKTPLATLHAFNGWADLFLATPAAGLRDTYVKAAVNLPAGLSLLAFEHWYAADSTGTALGTEFNLQLSRKFGKTITGLVKYADFRRESSANPNAQKFWAQVEFAL
ncbi:MAG: hypothetical protein PSV13_19435 [Lacunisphaera sp.]|nr:hypothetical protein [Lacunisphaera sp.]